MRLNALICGLLLHMALLPDAQAVTQSIAANGNSAATGQAFDYDQALAFSQAAIGTTVGDHAFVDAAGKTMTLSQLRGKPLVLSLVYTSCYQICPMTTRHLSKVVQKAREALGDDSFHIAVIGFDTSVDNPATMQYFANQQGISDKRWNLLSGRREAVDAVSADLGFQFFPSSTGFDHLIQATVVDAEGKVYRQVYGQVFDTPLLVDPLIELVLGRSPPEQPLLANLVSKIKLFCTTYDPARDGYYFDYSLFVGMLIGGSIILFAGTIVVRGMTRG